MISFAIALWIINKFEKLHITEEKQNVHLTPGL